MYDEDGLESDDDAQPKPKKRCVVCCLCWFVLCLLLCVLIRVVCVSKDKPKAKETRKDKKAKDMLANKQKKQERKEEKRREKEDKQTETEQTDRETETKDTRIDPAHLSPKTRARIIEEQREEREHAKMQQHQCLLCERIMPLTAHHLIPSACLFCCVCSFVRRFVRLFVCCFVCCFTTHTYRNDTRQVPGHGWQVHQGVFEHVHRHL